MSQVRLGKGSNPKKLNKTFLQSENSLFFFFFDNDKPSQAFLFFLKSSKALLNNDLNKR